MPKCTVWIKSAVNDAQYFLKAGPSATKQSELAWKVSFLSENMKDLQAQTQHTGSGEWFQGCMHNKTYTFKNECLQQQAAILMDERSNFEVCVK